MNATRVMPSAMAASILVLLAGGCQSDPFQRGSASVSPSGRMERPGATRTEASARAERGKVFGISEMSFPTGDADTSLVRLAAVPGSEQVRVGQPYTYELKVTNLSKEMTLESVAVHQELPRSMRIAGIKPEGMAQGDRPGTFLIGHLDPGETKAFEVALVPEEPGRFDTCVRVTYNPVLCTTIDVVAPELRLVKEAPERVLACEPIPMTYAVSNPGTGSAEDVIIRDRLPEGVTAPNGGNLIEINVGTLRAGESKRFPVRLTARRSGELVTEAMAMTRDGLEARAEARPILLWAPQLEVEVSGPEMEYAGKPVEYRAVVHNRGDGPATNAMLKLDVSPDAQLISSSVPVRGGQANVPLGDIGPGQSKEVVFAFQSPKPGEVRFAASASAPCANTEAQEVVTSLRGVSSLLLEVVDNFDPVKIGSQEVYQIMVVNQGSIEDRNVRILAEVPDAFEVVKTEGPTQPERDGNRLIFAPVTRLGPGQKVVWNVTVRAISPGDVRFRTEMVSDSLQEPVIETEATRVY